MTTLHSFQKEVPKEPPQKKPNPHNQQPLCWANIFYLNYTMLIKFSNLLIKTK